MKNFLLPALLFLTPFVQAGNPAFELRGGVWISTGEAEWTESDPGFTLLGIPGFRSELVYEDLDSLLPYIEAELRWDAFRLRATAATGAIDDAKDSDTDFALTPGGDFQTARSTSEVDGDATLIEVVLGYALPIDHDALQLDVFAGYSYYADELRLRNGVATPPSGGAFPIEGLDSRYDFFWHSLKIGLDGTFDLDGPLYLSGRAAIMPYVRYEGEAFWNLRTDFRATAPNFTHEADPGLGYELRAGIGGQWDRFQVEAGGWTQYWKADDGTGETFFASGEVVTVDVEAEAMRIGLYLQAGFQF